MKDQLITDRAYNRVTRLLTPVVHIQGNTYHDEVRDALKAIGRGGRGLIRVGVRDDGSEEWRGFAD